MPVITIAARPLPEAYKKAELVRKVTEATCEAYGVPVESIIVFIQEYPMENIGVAGGLISERAKSGT
jgi:4-oxalocrotonate tautomerase family enzyme